MQPPAPGGFGFGFPPPAQNAPKQKNADGREVHRNAFGVDLPWAVGTIEVDGERLENIAIRYKGNGTIMDAARTIKKSIKFDLDRRDPTKRFRGLKTLNLHSGVADPSKARDARLFGLSRRRRFRAANQTGGGHSHRSGETR